MPETPDEPEQILRADKTKRAQLLLGVTLIAIVGVVFVIVAKTVVNQVKEAGQQREAAEEDAVRAAAEHQLDAAQRHAARIARVCAWVVGLSVVGMGVWFGVLALRIARSGRFPPPGTKVIKDTRVRTGTQARRLALLAAVGCAVGILGGLALVWQLHRLARLVLPPGF